MIIDENSDSTQLSKIIESEQKLIEAIIKQCTDENLQGSLQKPKNHKNEDGEGYHYILPDSGLHVYACRSKCEPKDFVSMHITAEGLPTLREKQQVFYRSGGDKYSEACLRAYYDSSFNSNNAGRQIEYIMAIDNYGNIGEVRACPYASGTKVAFCVNLYDPTDGMSYSSKNSKWDTEYTSLPNGMIDIIKSTSFITEEKKHEFIKSINLLQEKLYIERVKAGLIVEKEEQRPKNPELSHERTADGVLRIENGQQGLGLGQETKELSTQK